MSVQTTLALCVGVAAVGTEHAIDQWMQLFYRGYISHLSTALLSTALLSTALHDPAAGAVHLDECDMDRQEYVCTAGRMVYVGLTG